LTWFTELHNPITFVAPNYSYIQLPLMELGHLPALLIGFDRLGAFSCLFGTMLQVAILLAVMTIIFVPDRLPLQILIAALAAAVFSNRMLVLTYNNFGYSVPAICLGLMLMVVVDQESIPDPDRTFGGLLLVAVLHHYSGLTQVLPIALLWLLLRTGGLRRFPAFVARNPLLVAAGAMFVITLAVNPDPFTIRLKHVTVGAAHAAPATSDEIVTKVQKNWPFLVHQFPGSFYHHVFIENGGSWTFLNIAPLGGWIGPLVAGGWILSAWSLRGHRLRCVLYFLSFLIVVSALAIVQHLLTDFSDYRDLTPIIALLISSLFFVFRLPRSGRGLRVVAACYAVAIAVFNYVDLGNLHGKVHSTADYAYVSQQTMERLVAYLERRPPLDLGVSRIYVVLDDFFPLKPFYLKNVERYGIPVVPIDAKNFCTDQGTAVETASAARCDGFLLVTHAQRCPGSGPSDDGARIRGDLYKSICGRPGAGLLDRGKVPIGLEETG
jgi:hypothetical protein